MSQPGGTQLAYGEHEGWWPFLSPHVIAPDVGYPYPPRKGPGSPFPISLAAYQVSWLYWRVRAWRVKIHITETIGEEENERAVDKTFDLTNPEDLTVNFGRQYSSQAQMVLDRAAPYSTFSPHQFYDPTEDLSLRLFAQERVTESGGQRRPIIEADERVWPGLFLRWGPGSVSTIISYLFADLPSLACGEMQLQDINGGAMARGSITLHEPNFGSPGSITVNEAFIQVAGLWNE